MWSLCVKIMINISGRTYLTEKMTLTITHCLRSVRVGLTGGRGKWRGNSPTRIEDPCADAVLFLTSLGMGPDISQRLDLGFFFMKRKCFKNIFLMKYNQLNIMTMCIFKENNSKMKNSWWIFINIVFTQHKRIVY